jgi:gliding motility-associated-like protein
MKRILLSLLTLALISFNQVVAQCSAAVPTFVVDLSSSPDATYLSPNTGRAGVCCVTSDNCVEFVITLHPDAVGIIFDIYSGAVPPGALFYQVGCGPETQVGTGICLTSAGPHRLSFCKPGGNANEFTIRSISKPTVSGDITLNEGCSGQLTASEFNTASITWNSIYPGATGAYNGFLSCTSACATTNVQSNGVFPPYVDYQVCGSPIGGCSSLVICDTVRVFFNATLAVSLVANPPIICYGGPNSTITATISGGSSPYNVTWSTGATVNNTTSTTHSISVSAGGTYSITITDASSGCPGVSSSINITENTIAPFVNAGADQKVCEDHFPIQLNGAINGVDGIRWSGGNGTFSNSNITNPTYMPTQGETTNGFVVLTAEGYFNAVCPSVFDQVTIYLSPNTIATNMVSTPGTLCYGETSVQINANITGGVLPYQSIVWNDGVTGNPRDATTGGTYTVTITDDYGCTHSNSITIQQITQAPVINVGPDQTLCVDPFAGGTSPIQLNATTNLDGVRWTGGNGTFSNPNIPNPTYMPTQTEANGGVVTLTAEAYYNGGICPSVYDQVTLRLYIFSSQTNVTHTNLTCYRTDDGTATVNLGNDGPHTISWLSQGGSSANPINNLAAGTHSVRVTNAGGCSVVFNINVTQPDPLVMNLLRKEDLTCYESNDGKIEVASTGGNVGHNYFINGAPTAPLAQNLAAGNYGVEVIDSKGCSDDLSETLIQPDPLLLNINVNNVRCYGEISGSIQVQAQGGTAPYTSGVFNYSGNYAVLNNLIAGIYTVDVKDDNGCTFAQQVTVTQPNELISNFTVSKDTFCLGEVISVNSTVIGGTPNYQYQWSNPLVSGPYGFFYAQQTENITLTVTDANGCQHVYTDGYYVPTLNAADFTFNLSKDVICYGEQVTVSAFYNGDNYPLNVTWNNGFNGLGTFTDAPTSNSVYQVYVTDKCNNIFTDQKNITVNALPQIYLPEIVEEGCPPLTVDFSKYPQSSTIKEFFWEFGNGTISKEDEPYVIFTKSGEFNIKLSVVDENGCKNSKSGDSKIVVYPEPHSSPSAANLIVDEYSPIIQFYNKSYGHNEFTWNFGDGYYSSTEEQPVHTYERTGTFIVELAVVNEYGCKDKEYLTVEVRPVTNVFIPSAFSPNNDRLNDILYVVGYNIDPNQFEFEIFNRWGEKIFMTNQVEEGWDGTYKGEVVPQGNYVYKVNLLDALGNKQQLVGSVAVIR